MLSSTAILERSFLAHFYYNYNIKTNITNHRGISQFFICEICTPGLHSKIQKIISFPGIYLFFKCLFSIYLSVLLFIHKGRYRFCLKSYGAKLCDFNVSFFDICLGGNRWTFYLMMMLELFQDMATSLCNLGQIFIEKEIWKKNLKNKTFVLFCDDIFGLKYKM